MTFIVGINLSDRVLLSADTRLTFRENKTEKFYDCFLKIKPLSQEIVAAVAGDPKLAAFIVKGLILSKINKENIRNFREDIEEQIKKLVDGYQTKYKIFDRNVCFIFAGIDREKKKNIDMKRYLEITTEFQKETNEPMQIKDIVLQGLKEKKKHSKKFEINLPDSHVFCVQVSPRGIKIEDVEWGDYIAYGAGLNKDSLPIGFIGQFEVSANSGKIENNKVWLDIFLKEVAEKYKKNTIGGCVTSFLISDKDSGILLGGTAKMNPENGHKEKISEIQIIDKKPHGLVNGKMQQLISFIRYEDMILKDYPKAENLEL